MERITLSRFLLAGPLLPSVPATLLLEIAACHGLACRDGAELSSVYLDKLRQRLQQVEPPTISSFSGKENLSLLCRYVNPAPLPGWTGHLLMEAFRFLQSFMQEGDLLSLLPYPTLFSCQTPQDTRALNACIVYRVCRRYGLPCLDYREMCRSVSLLAESAQVLVGHIGSWLANSSNRLELVRLLSRSDSQAPVEHDALSRAHSDFGSILSLRLLVQPTSPSQAVALAALCFGLNISRSSCPLLDYRLLKEEGREAWVPSDGSLRLIKERNPSLLDLKKSFDPIFPLAYYQTGDLYEMARREGYLGGPDLSYEQLQIAYLSPTFHAGWQPESEGTQSPLLMEEWGEIPAAEVLCYGQKGGRMQICSYSEINETFTVYGRTHSLFSREEPLSPESLRKLSSMCQERAQELASCRQLLHTLRLLEESSQLLPEERELLLLCSRSAEGQEAVERALLLLLQAAMYMRGWDGAGPYPLSDTTVHNQNQVDDHVTQAIASLEETCRQSEGGRLVLTLPLYQYSQRAYARSVDAERGLTIGERIDIVKGGGVSDNIHACIRLSSNWLGASAHHYITLLGLPPPFPIEELRHIS